jgi:hypothetical protein
LKKLFKILIALILTNLTVGCALIPKTGFPDDDVFNYIAGFSCPSTETKTDYGGDGYGGDYDTSLRFPVSKYQLQNDGNQSEFFLSYRVGAKLKLPLNDKFSLSPAMVLSGKGNKNSNAGFEDKLTSTYIDVPLMINYKLGNSKFSLNGGLQPSILLSAKRKITGNGNDQSQKVTDQFNTFDLAASIGAGYQFDNGFGLNFGYDYGLTNINKSDGGFKAYNRVLQLGISYNFNKNK